MTSLTDGLDPWRGRPPDWPTHVRRLVHVKAQRGRFHRLTDTDIEQAADAAVRRVENERRRSKVQSNPAATLELLTRNVLIDQVRFRAHRPEVPIDGLPEASERPADGDTRACARLVRRELWLAHDERTRAVAEARRSEDEDRVQREQRRLDAVMSLLGRIWPEMAPDLEGAPKPYRESVLYQEKTLRLAICRLSEACKNTGYCERAFEFGEQQRGKREAQRAKRSGEEKG